MPRYRVRAPDGRTVTLTGDRPPTDEDLDEIFAGLPLAGQSAAQRDRNRGGGGGIPSPRPNPPQSLLERAMSAIPEGVQQASSSFLSGVPDFLRGAAQEAPLVAMRAARMPQRLIGRAAEATGLASPEVSQRIRDQQEAVDYGMEAPFLPDEDAGLAESLGRGVTRAAPQVALGVATGGASLPAQMALAAGSQGAQALSEGASGGEAALQAGLAAGGQGLGAAVGAAARPFARSISQRTLEAARRLGIELPASALTDSAVAQTIEGAAAKGVGGGRITRRATQAVEELGGLGEDIAAGANPEAAGAGLARDYQAARSGLREAKNTAYGQVGDLTGIEANPQQTLAQIDAILREGTAAPDVLARLRQLRASIAPVEEGVTLGGQTIPASVAGGAATRPRSAADLISQQAGIEYGGPNALGDEALANRLRGSLGSDVDEALAASSPEQLTARNAAKSAYREYAQLSGSSFGRRISTLADQGQFDKVASIIRSTESTPNIRRMTELMSPETLGEIRSNVMADIVGRATRGGNFSPQSLERSIRQWSPDKLRLILEPDQVQRLQDISEVARALGKSTRVTGGSQTAYLVRQMAHVSNPMLAMRSLLGEVPLSAFLGSEAGQRWLTSGIMPNAGRNVTAAGRLGASMAGGPIRDYAREVELARRARQTAR